MGQNNCACVCTSNRLNDNTSHKDNLQLTINDNWRKHVQSKPCKDSVTVESLPVISANHLARESEDCARLKEFYINVLGFKEVFRPEWIAKRHDGAWLQLCENDIQIHIIERVQKSTLPESVYNTNGKEWDKSKSIARGPHLALATMNFDEVVNRLKLFEIEYFCSSNGPDSRKQLFFYDCDGYGVEIIDCQDQNANGKEPFNVLEKLRGGENNKQYNKVEV